MVHSLINAYGISKSLYRLPPQPATIEELERYHDPDYIRHGLQHHTDCSQDSKEEFGLVDDCPVFESLWPYVQWTAGSTLAAARYLLADHLDVAIHWEGGRHHAGRAKASGFCYVNDCVLAILELRKRFKRVLYIDLDLHHGDGVEEAFRYSSNVFTFSMHRRELGFFPGTGDEDSMGICLRNVPLKQGLGDSKFGELFVANMTDILESFQPDALVVVMGADGLVGDPLGQWNLTGKAFQHAIEFILALEKPLLLLGGGIYYLIFKHLERRFLHHSDNL